MKHIVYIILTLMLLVSGCAPRKEIDHLAIGSLICIDWQGDQYKVGFQFIESKLKGAREKETKEIWLSDTGKTVSEAIQKIQMSTSKRIFFRKAKFLLFSERAARHGLAPALILFGGTSAETGVPDIKVFVVREEEMERLREFKPMMHDTVDLELEGVLELNRQLYPTKIWDVTETAQKMQREDFFLLMSIKISGKQIETREVAYMEGDKLKEMISLKDLRGLVWLTENGKKTVLPVETEGGIHGVQIDNVKFSKPRQHMQIRLSIMENQSKTEEPEKTSKIIEEKVKKIIQDDLYKLYANHQKIFRKYADTPEDVLIEVKVKDLGTTKKPIKVKDSD